MPPLSDQTLASLWQDRDLSEEQLRAVVHDRLAAAPPPHADDQIVATYFLALRTQTLADIGAEIAYHATSGSRQPAPGSLMAECTGRTLGLDCWDATGRLGLLHVAYPLKMLLNSRGTLTSCDLLHTAAGAILFDVYENQDCRLLRLSIPPQVLQTFPGPAHGALGIREMLHLRPEEPALGTILKPTAGVTPEDVGALVAELARHSQIAFIKEDENLYPGLPYSPVAERTRRAVEAIERARHERGDRPLVFAPHLSSSPAEIVDFVMAVVEAGATGVMFSESFAGGAVRMVRDAVKHLPRVPAIYGHNAGIGVRTRCIWREVIDLLARLDGIDFRQTAPVRDGAPFIRPYRAEWGASESTLTQRLEGVRPVMIARAGGLDQGNILLNVHDALNSGKMPLVLFLAGSAINSVKNSKGRADASLGVAAMQEAIDLYQSGGIDEFDPTRHTRALFRIANDRRLQALSAALVQRYAFN